MHAYLAVGWFMLSATDGSITVVPFLHKAVREKGDKKAKK